MQHTTIWALALAGLATWAQPAQAADVGVSIGISQPGVYGRIDIGRFPQPELIVQQPVLVQRHYFRRSPEPVYLWVPPGHQRNWRQYCGQYDACGRPVYFVQDNWYRDRGPGREFYHGGRGDDRGDGHGDGHGDGRGDRHDDRGEGHGKGHDNGRGHGNGKGRD